MKEFKEYFVEAEEIIDEMKKPNYSDAYKTNDMYSLMTKAKAKDIINDYFDKENPKLRPNPGQIAKKAEELTKEWNAMVDDMDKKKENIKEKMKNKQSILKRIIKSLTSTEDDAYSSNNYKRKERKAKVVLDKAKTNFE